MIDRYFNPNKFLEYEKLKTLSIQKQQNSNSNKKQKMFLGMKQNFPDISKTNNGDGS